MTNTIGPHASRVLPIYIDDLANISSILNMTLLMLPTCFNQVET